MKDATVVSYDPLPGDAIAVLPTICALAEVYAHVYVDMMNSAIYEIADFPRNVSHAWGHPAKDPDRYFLGMAAAFNWRFTPDMLHPTQMIMRLAGIPVAQTVPQPRIKPYTLDAPVEVYDVILAPFTTAPNRTLTLAQTEDLVELLKPLKVAILGGGSNPCVPNVPCYYNNHFAYGAELIRRAKLVIAVDSFPGRLAHAAGAFRHIVLNTGATPLQTQVYPGAIAMNAHDIEAVAEQAKGML